MSIYGITGSATYSITYSSLDEMLASLPNNNRQQISAQEVRNSVYTLWNTIGASGGSGFQGSQGLVGIGSQGFQGRQGIIGLTGIQGFQGGIGLQGSAGSTSSQNLQTVTINGNTTTEDIILLTATSSATVATLGSSLSSGVEFGYLNIVNLRTDSDNSYTLDINSNRILSTNRSNGGTLNIRLDNLGGGASSLLKFPITSDTLNTRTLSVSVNGTFANSSGDVNLSAFTIAQTLTAGSIVNEITLSNDSLNPYFHAENDFFGFFRDTNPTLDYNYSIPEYFTLNTKNLSLGSLIARVVVAGGVDETLVGINELNPSSTLHVDGTGRFTDSITSDSLSGYGENKLLSADNNGTIGITNIVNLGNDLDSQTSTFLTMWTEVVTSDGPTSLEVEVFVNGINGQRFPLIGESIYCVTMQITQVKGGDITNTATKYAIYNFAFNTDSLSAPDNLTYQQTFGVDFASIVIDGNEIKIFGEERESSATMRCTASLWINRTRSTL